MGRNRSHYAVPESLRDFYTLHAMYNLRTQRNEYLWRCDICQRGVEPGEPAIAHLRDHDVAATMTRRILGK